MTAVPTLDPDRRAFPRRRVLKRGKIVFNSSKSVIDCMIRDLSQGGARLACSQTANLPETFSLVSVSERELREVRIAWRQIGEVGVQFVSEPRKALRLLV
ncbi:PilZ domain-containing protein [Aestuariivirga sp.]|uniref:PilZ domain-containing protein n=1 Tax=Aestuariivirga sp. TaxID=2650926 RepID=UPI003BAB1F89